MQASGKAVSYGVQQGDCLAGGLLLAAAVAGDEEALHAGAQRVRALPHRLAVGEELALPPAAGVGVGLSRGGGHLDLMAGVSLGFLLLASLRVCAAGASRGGFW